MDVRPQGTEVSGRHLLGFALSPGPRVTRNDITVVIPCIEKPRNITYVLLWVLSMSLSLSTTYCHSVETGFLQNDSLNFIVSH